jgi:hypothetical protein
MATRAISDWTIARRLSGRNGSTVCAQTCDGTSLPSEVRSTPRSKGRLAVSYADVLLDRDFIGRKRVMRTAWFGHRRKGIT